MFNTNNLRTLPLLPIKNTVLFPFIHMPFSVGRPQSLAALEKAIATEEKEVVVVSQRDSAVEVPTKRDLYSIGTTAVIKRVTRPEDGRVQVIVLGGERVRIEDFSRTEPYLEARIVPYPLPVDETPEVEALHRELVALALKALSLTQPQAPLEVSQALLSGESTMELGFTMPSISGLDPENQQAPLESHP